MDLAQISIWITQYYCRGGRRHHCLHGTRRGTRSRTRQHSNCAILGLCKQPQNRASGRLCRPIRMAVKSTAAFGDMRQHLVKIYSGVTVAHSLSRDKEVSDCVPINDQPGVRVRKLKRVAKPPPIPPTSVGWGRAEQFAERRETDAAGGLEAFGRGCETAPFRCGG